MESKAAEAYAAPPSYEQVAEEQNRANESRNVTIGGPDQSSTTINGVAGYPVQPPTPYMFPGTTSIPPPLGDPTRQAAPILLSARTSVYGATPVETDCPYCHAHIVTHIERVAGILPWIILSVCIILGFFLFGIPWCFCCVPFCLDPCLDVIHSCPCCKRHLGRFSRV